MKYVAASAACLTLILAAGTASAATLTLDCRVHAEKPGFERNGVRRLEIDLSAKTVRVSNNTGQGFRVEGVKPIVSVSPTRIVLENSGGKTSDLDRVSGQYFFRNVPEKLVIQGLCTPARPSRPRF